MRERKYLVGALLSAIGTLVVSGTASAAVTGQTLKTTTAPAKQKKKAFGVVKSFRNDVDTAYTAPFTPNATQTVLTFSKDIRFTPGNTPQCNLAVIATVPEAQADAACGGSRIGSGSTNIVSLTGAQLTGRVAAYNGVRSGGNPTIGLHVDVFLPTGQYGFSTQLTGVLNAKANVLTVSIPPTGTSITHLDFTITRRKTGRKTFFVMARCRKGKWTNSETTTFNDGTSLTATSTQKCKGLKG
jgi:hypothetical protein